jgi:hypothetical protein
MAKCTIEVEKVYQSPSTPVFEVAYLVKMVNPEDAQNFERDLLVYLERKSRPNFESES